ncbi:phospho-N-acetylmuramoyl-pentapeptide-transferase [Oenococcus alcoholitolerans]|uniref:Phospho-N-acetylmuramoyl-pentapeptide-transferase n=1 Tax=Oenococcus alcoholitolerans TaxID=931074 RepID=A0ABR4XSA4_9LACO|nr:phospho-N-acetylmuramoyl-pentapeptide-transferase [Oenococcus alcoholitolerans]
MIFLGLAALILAFVLAFLSLPILINYLRTRGEVGVERSGKHGFGVDTSFKNGTPSMGGISFVISSAISSFLVLLFTNNLNLTFLLIIAALFSFGLIGLIDDILKVIYHRDDGFRFIPKLIAQIIAGLVSTVIFFSSGLNDQLTFSFLKVIPGFLIIQFIFYLIWFVGWSNAANFVDGIDGLLAGISVIMFAGFAYLAFSYHKNIIGLFDLALIGSLFAYLFFNKPKASVFMGDCGSMALGAAMAANSLLLGNPWSLVWFGLIPFLDTISVMIQVTVYHFFHFRVFPVAPLQHIFQKKNWHEWNIDILFWLIQLIITVIGVFIWMK